VKILSKAFNMRATRRFRTRKSGGFTLIELMVTIVIAAVLISIAVPTYQSSIRKSRRTEARTALLDFASRQERFNSTNSSYSDLPANLGYAGAFPITVGSGYYQVSVCVNTTLPCTADAGTGTKFLLTATPVGAQVKDTICGSFTLDNTGAEAVTGTASATPATCWN
jgi:type IV pilus assembly protein PilE